MERKFRSLYIGALAVIMVGLLGIVVVPKAHADTWVDSEAGPNHHLQHSVSRRLSEASDTNLLIGALGLGFLSFSGMISLFTKRST